MKTKLFIKIVLLVLVACPMFYISAKADHEYIPETIVVNTRENPVFVQNRNDHITPVILQKQKNCKTSECEVLICEVPKGKRLRIQYASVYASVTKQIDQHIQPISFIKITSDFAEFSHVIGIPFPCPKALKYPYDPPGIALAMGKSVNLYANQGSKVFVRMNTGDASHIVNIVGTFSGYFEPMIYITPQE